VERAFEIPVATLESIPGKLAKIDALSKADENGAIGVRGGIGGANVVETNIVTIGVINPVRPT